MIRNLQGAMLAVIGSLVFSGSAAVTMSSAQEAAPQPLNCTSPDAVSLAPMSASTVTLGAYTGVAYYTVEASGYQVVATVAPGEVGAPIRFVSTLADGQHAILSVPHAVESSALEIEFHRCGDAMVMRSPINLPPAIAIVE